MKKKNVLIPFNFVLDYFVPIPYIIKPMFGCHAIYLGNKIIMILRKRNHHEEDNGIWLATTIEHHASLKKDFPCLRSIKVISSGGVTGWQLIPADDDHFEQLAIKACELILKNDLRIGKIPAIKKRKRQQHHELS